MHSRDTYGLQQQMSHACATFEIMGRNGKKLAWFDLQKWNCHPSDRGIVREGLTSVKKEKVLEVFLANVS